MTQGTDLLRLFVRRWYFFAAALVAAVAGIVVLYDAPRIYTSEAQVSFEPPLAVTRSEEWVDYTESLVFFSQVVDMTHAAAHPSIRLSAPRATLFGNGVRDGTAVQVHANGNQWVKQLDRPMIVVNVNGTDERLVRSRLDEAVHRVAETADRVQADVGVPATQRIVAVWNEEEYGVGSFNRSRQATVKGAAVLLGGSAVFAILAASAVEARSRHGRRSHPHDDSSRTVEGDALHGLELRP